MSIQISFDGDVYSFASSEGQNYWYLSGRNRPSFSKMLGMIVRADLNASLYQAAFAQGYTEADFDLLRTTSPAKTRTVSASGKSVRIQSGKVTGASKAPARKSTLSQSVKLF